MNLCLKCHLNPSYIKEKKYVKESELVENDP